MITEKQFNEAKKIWLDYIKEQSESLRKDAESNYNTQEELKGYDKEFGGNIIIFHRPNFLSNLKDNFKKLNTKLTIEQIEKVVDKLIKLIFNESDQLLHKEKKYEFNYSYNSYRYNLDGNGAEVLINCYENGYFIFLVAKKDWDKFCEFVMNLDLNLD